MKRWAEIIDHGDDPGRYTVIFGTGEIVTINADGSHIFQRRCHNPMGIVTSLSREPGARIVKYRPKDDLLKKAGMLTESGRPTAPKRKEYLPDEVIAQRVAYSLRRWPYTDQPKEGSQKPTEHYEDLDTISDKPQ